MESSEVSARSVLTSVALFGAGTLVGAGITWLIMLAAGSDLDRGCGGSPRGSTTSPGSDDDACGGQSRMFRQRCSERLRCILADLEVRLMDAVDELVTHFTRDGDQTSKPCRKPSSRDDTRSKSQCVHFESPIHYAFISNNLSV